MHTNPDLVRLEPNQRNQTKLLFLGTRPNYRGDYHKLILKVSHIQNTEELGNAVCNLKLGMM